MLRYAPGIYFLACVAVKTRQNLSYPVLRKELHVHAVEMIST